MHLANETGRGFAVWISSVPQVGRLSRKRPLRFFPRPRLGLRQGLSLECCDVRHCILARTWQKSPHIACGWAWG